jgi:hypothetical protein
MTTCRERRLSEHVRVRVTLRDPALTLRNRLQHPYNIHPSSARASRAAASVSMLCVTCE